MDKEELQDNPVDNTETPVDEKSGEEQKAAKRRERIIFVLGMIVGALIVVWTYIGVTYYRYNKEINRLKALSSQNAQTASGVSNAALQHASVVNDETNNKLRTIEKLINKKYYQDVEVSTLEDGMYEGMLKALGDPYSEYYSYSEMEQFKLESQGIYYGIGAYISTDPETEFPIISGIIPGTPAEEAGLQEGDIFYKVDGIDATGMTTTEVVSHVKGDEHTIVHLSMIRDGEVVELDVERRKIKSPTVKYEMRENNIGYIQITTFEDITADQFTEALAVLNGQGMKGLIIDLRSNGGGNFDTCCEIARHLLPEGLIVYTEDKYGNRDEEKCDGTRKFDKPLVVLVNGLSASASEILTGAIKDYKLGTIMGTTTYGKGIVQQIISLNDGTAIKITTSKYFTPNGNYIHEKGIEPDIVVEFDPETYERDVYDNQIEAAENELKRQMNIK